MKSYSQNKKKTGRFIVYLSGLLASIAITPIYAQTIGNVPQPASPDGAALARNISIPMEYYTGRANVQIPLYAVESRDISIPITLSYQSSGIKVQDLPTWVGLGWNLSAGGKVSRIVRGAPDEKNYLIPGNTTSLQWVLEHEQWSVEKFNRLLESQNNYATDGQPDIFYFEIPGKSGMFVLDTIGVAHTIPYQDVKIEWVNKNYFRITDENGNRFTLGNSNSSKELIQQTISDTTFDYELDKDHNLWDHTHTIDYVSSWLLNKVISPSGDSVTFQYETAASYSFDSKDKSSLHRLDMQGKLLKTIQNYTQYTLTEIKRPVYLKKIQWKNGELRFVSAASIADIANMRLLRLIEIYADGQFLRNIKFDYGLFGNRSLKLMKVYESGLSAPLRSICSFEYNEDETMPARNSQDFDHWGFYNGNQGDTTYLKEHNHGMDILFICKKRESDLHYAQTSSLKAIVYPYGGRKEFEYELNEGLRPDGNLTRGGGLRVKRILEYETATAEKKITRYDYSDATGRSSGRIYPIAPSYILDQNTMGIYKFYMKHNSNVNFISDINGLSIVYGQVKEILPDNSYNVYTYSTEPDVPGTICAVPTHGKIQDINFYSDVSGLVPATTQYWHRGLPEKTVQYNASGQVVMEKHYTFLASGGVKVVPAYYLTRMKVETPDKDSVTDRCMAQYRYVSYPMHPVEEVTLKSPYSLPLTTRYLYNNHPLLPSEVVTIDANSDTTRSRFKYAADYFNLLPVSSSDTMVQALKIMQALHMVAVPIERITERNGRVFEGEITTYRIGSADSTIVKHKTKKTIMERPLPKSQFPFSEFSEGRFINHSSYRDMTTADHYDSDNNLIQCHDRYGHYKSAIYGYDGTLPIAIVDNARSCISALKRENEIFHTSFEENGSLNYPDNNDTKTGQYIHRGAYSIPLSNFRAGTYILTYWRQAAQSDPWEFVSKEITVPASNVQGLVTTIGQTDYCIDEVRIFPKGAKMATTTYDPNVGITSETDHNGITKYYAYDKLGRLIRIMDNGRKVIESYEYKK